MLLSRSTLRKATATLLPLTFLWLCAACAFICGRETAPSVGRLPGAPSAGRVEAGGTPACGGCPFASFPKATAPERTAFDAASRAPDADLPPSRAAYSSAAVVFVRARGPSPPAPSPPRLLPTLRI